MFFNRLSVISKIAILFTPLVLIVTQAKATPINPGFDVFSTPMYSTTISSVQLNTPGGTIDVGNMGVTLESLPLSFWNSDARSLGNTDTIVARKQGIDPLNGSTNATIDIELVALSLKSVNPIDLSLFGGAGTADMYVLVSGLFEDVTAGGNGDGICDLGETCIDLGLPTSGNQPSSVGQITNLTHENSDGGTFESFYPNIFVDLLFTEVGNVNNILFTGSASDSLTSSGSSWIHTAPEDYSLDTTAGNSILLQSGNFYVAEAIHTGPHPRVVAATVPEPSSLLLLSLGLLPLAYRRKNKV